MSNVVDESRTTAIGLWTDAKDMLAAAEALMQQQAKSSREHMRLLSPTYFLLGHGIEVSLKSVLLANGSSLDELRKNLGHDLDKAVERVIALDLDPRSGFVASNASRVQMLNPYYRAKVFEYRVTGTMRLPPEGEIAALLFGLVKLTTPKLEKR